MHWIHKTVRQVVSFAGIAEYQSWNQTLPYTFQKSPVQTNLALLVGSLVVVGRAGLFTMLSIQIRSKNFIHNNLNQSTGIWRSKSWICHTEVFLWQAEILHNTPWCQEALVQLLHRKLKDQRLKEHVSGWHSRGPFYRLNSKFKQQSGAELGLLTKHTEKALCCLWEHFFSLKSNRIHIHKSKNILLTEN